MISREYILELLLWVELKETPDNFGPLLREVSLHMGNDTTDLTVNFLGAAGTLTWNDPGYIILIVKFHDLKVLQVPTYLVRFRVPWDAIDGRDHHKDHGPKRSWWGTERIPCPSKPFQWQSSAGHFSSPEGGCQQRRLDTGRRSGSTKQGEGWNWDTSFQRTKHSRNQSWPLSKGLCII